MENSKEKIKKVLNKIITYLLNWKKKHKILSFIICAFIVIKVTCFPLYVYRYFKYGHFEKVAIKYSNWEYSDLYETKDTIQYDYDTIIEKGTLLLHLTNFNSPSTKITGYKEYTQMNNLLLYMRSFVVNEQYQLFNKYTDLVVYGNSIDDFLYMYDKKRKKFIKLDTKNRKFDNIRKKVKPTNFKMDEHFLEDTIFRLDDNNLLITNYVEGLKKFDYLRLSVNDNKYHKIDTSEVEDIYSSVIQLKKDKFLFILRGSTFAPLEYIGLYELKDDKFKKINIPLPKNYKKYNFSIDNPLVLDENRVIFIGGDVGGYIFGWWTKACYLYDIKKAKIIKINDFPIFVGRLKFLKTSDGENYIHFSDQIDEAFPNGKHYVYRYKK